MRLLHVIERVGFHAQGDWSALACRAFVDGAAEHEHVVAFAGSRADEVRAWSLGVRTWERINPVPCGATVEPAGVRAFERDRAPFQHVLHWGAGRSMRRSKAGPPRTRIELGSGIRNPLGARAPGTPRRDAHVGLWSLPPDHVPVLGPTADEERRTRAGWRAQLGLAPADVGILLVGHAGDPRAGGQFVFTLGLVEASGWPIVGILPASPGQSGRAARLQRPSNIPSRMVYPETPEAMLLGAADAIVVCPRSWLADGESLTEHTGEVDPCVFMSALASGRPVIAPRTPRSQALSEFLGAPCELLANATLAETARGLLHSIEAGSHREIPVDPTCFATSHRQFADKIVDRLDVR